MIQLAISDTKESLGTYIDWYNYERRHSSLGKNLPHEVMTGKKRASKEAFLVIAHSRVENSSEFTERFINITTTKKKVKRIQNKKEVSSQVAA
jgi:hypothetical protein